MTPDQSQSPDLLEGLSRRLGPVIVAIVAVIMIAWTWFAWPDPVVDFGRELYVPWQIVEGKVLYRDLAYFNGPLSPYFNAVVFRVAGVSLRSLVIANLLILGLIIVMIWRLWSLIADHLSAFLATLTLVAVFAFLQLTEGIGNYNFVTPYSHELTHGIALSLGAMLCLDGYARKGRAICVSAAGLLVGMTILTKAEIFLAAFAAVSLGMLLSLWSARASLRRAFAALLQYGFALLVAPVIAVILLSLAIPLPEALRGTIGSWAYLLGTDVTRIQFYGRVLGTFDTANNIHQILETLIWHVAVVGIIGTIALAIRHPRARAPATVASIILTAAGLWALKQLVQIHWDRAFAAIPIINAAIVAGLIVAIARQRRALGWRLILQTTVATFALLLLAKIFVNVMLYHYGFALAMPATLVIIPLLVSWWPRFIDRRGGTGIVLRSASVAIVGFVIYIHLHFFALIGADKRTLVGSGPDAFRADVVRYNALGEIDRTDRRGIAINHMLQTLARVSKGATLATVPEGTMLNYLSRRANPTPYYNLMPPEVVMFGQESILSAFQKNPPDYIVLILHSDPSTFGYKSFSADYGRAIYLWIEANYHEIPAATVPEYPLVLLKRNAI